ncbi:DUF4132 domain-containing protein [Spirillospora sp. NBC_01491]|uniref:DUF4132 domain-containing protein n=1 Tax=Spirillospora sp. NBC_01491 TaxID=2976007 RepID=UPI002E32C3AC|nr:DUF4132 domain-containing protein [Spirillospora sp. NBC_01491]
MDDQLPSDEDVLVLPESLRGGVHPRRGGPPGPAVEMAGDAAERVRVLMEFDRDHIDEALADPAADRGMVEGARRHLGGEADPMGAAVVAEIICTGRDDRYHLEELFTDSWIAGHGLAFAACAFAELPDVSAHQSLHSMYADPFWGPTWGGRPPSGEAARRVRVLLANAGDAEYLDAVERLAAFRRSPMQRLVVSYLVPTRDDWVEECCALETPWSLKRFLLPSVSTRAHVELLSGWLRLGYDDCRDGSVITMTESLGPMVLPLLAAGMDANGMPSIGHAELLAAIGVLPTDEAFAAMVERIELQEAQTALLTAMERFPVRAVRLLSPAGAGTSRAAELATELLKAHLRAHPELAARGDLPAEAAALAASVIRVPDAPAETVPRDLVEPPWLRPKEKAKKPKAVQRDDLPVVTGLTPPAGSEVVWEPGERERWRDAGHTSRHGHDDWDERKWKQAVQGFDAGSMGFRPWEQARFLAAGPDEFVRPLLGEWNPELGMLDVRHIKPLAARYERDVLDVVYGVAKRFPTDKGGLLLPYLRADVARLAADWLVRLPSARDQARAWFARHGLTAVPYLVPDALGKRAAPRRNAGAALRLIAADRGRDEVVRAARAHGDQAAEAVAAMLSAEAPEPVAENPAVAPAKRRPTPRPVPGWADPAALPQVLLPGRDRALPDSATRHLLTMLATSRPDEIYPEVTTVAAACDPGSLAEFGWALFRRWQMLGMPPADGWALTALGPLGDDDVVRRLSSLIRAWPGEGGHARAVRGLAVLAGIGTEVALMHLHGIAQRVKYGGIRAAAQERIGQIAESLGLTADELGDRLVPDLGLDAGGALTLDYGPRRFVVGFDEQLKPQVFDEDGTRRKFLPKPGAKDDADLAPAAYSRFAALKKDVRALASDLLLRLETAMVVGRHWTPAGFRAFFVEHPLVWHIARRVVWVAEDGDRVTTFRVAEDSTFADVQDDPFDLPESARVGIMHPLPLGDAVAAWSVVFADYEILQPFPQLGRPVHVLTDEERTTGRLKRFEGLKVPSGALLGLERHGWERVQDDRAIVDQVVRDLADGARVSIEFEPGIFIGDLDHTEEQLLERVTLVGAAGAVAASEILGDLERLTAGTTAGE